MSDQAIMRAELLLKQGRYAEAETILQNLLAEHPDDPLVLAFLAEVKLRLDQFDSADVFVDSALGMRPDSGFLYHLKARIAIQKDEYDTAESLLLKAIDCDPEDADFFATLASVKLARKQFQAALELSDQALELDPEHILALNNRSRALLKLNKKDDSFRTIEGALREDPNNAYTHANYGWNLLEKGDHKKALEHFSQALKNSPGMDIARAGMVEALKASNPVYRLFLKYTFWMSNLTKKYQWGVIIGFYVATQLLKKVAARYEAVQPYVTPILVLILIFAFSTWLMNPLSNLLFRLSKYGKHLLKKKEVVSSNFVGASLTLFLLGLCLFFLLQDERWLAVTVFGFTMMLPLGVMFNPTKFRHVLVYYSAALALLGLAGIWSTFVTGRLDNAFSIAYLIGFVAFQWGANFIMIREANA